MATHSSIFAWRIPGMGEPGGLLSIGSHRVGHDWSELAAAVVVLSSIVAVSIYIPTNSARAFSFLTPSPAFIYRLFDEGPSDWCEVISHCSFDLHFSNNEWYWAYFHVFVSHLYVFFGEISVEVFSPLFDWVVFFWCWVVPINFYIIYTYQYLSLCVYVCVYLISSW